MRAFNSPAQAGWAKATSQGGIGLPYSPRLHPALVRVPGVVKGCRLSQGRLNVARAEGGMEPAAGNALPG